MERGEKERTKRERGFNGDRLKITFEKKNLLCPLDWLFDFTFARKIVLFSIGPLPSVKEDSMRKESLRNDANAFVYLARCYP